MSEKTRSIIRSYLHRADVFEQVCDIHVRPVAPGVLQREQREKATIVGLIAIDLCLGAAAGRWAVQHGAQVVLENTHQEQNPPPANPDRVKP